MNESFEQLLDRLRGATTPSDVFGALAANDEAALRRRYLELVRVAHPDRNPGVPEATEAFRLLQHWNEQAQQAVGRGGTATVDFAVTTRRTTYNATTSPLQGDLCDFYEATDQSGDVLLKVVRDARDNDLMEAEIEALQTIGRELAGKRVLAHFPTLVDTFRMKDSDGAMRQITVQRYDRRFVSLAEVVKAFRHGIDPADTGWMFNRILAALGSAHNIGLVHGAIVLEHILIRPHDHNGMLVDWCYSVESGMTVAAISPPYSVDYAPEVHAKQAATPATDLYMAARVMVRLLGGNGDADSLPPHVPRAMQALLRACLIPAPHRRYQDAWQVFDDWQEMLGRLYGEPTFRPFQMPKRGR